MNRRQFLAASCAGTIVSISGCLSLFDSTVQLGGLSVVNYDNESKEIEIRVERDGTTLRESTIELPETDDPTVSTAERKPVECTWDDDDGEYVIEASVSGGELNSFEVAENVEDDCVAVEIEVYQDDTVNYSTTSCSGLAPGRRETPWGCPFLEE